MEEGGLSLIHISKGGQLKHGSWVTITAEVKVEYEETYGEVGPVLYCSSVEPAEEADPEVAQF